VRTLFITEDAPYPARTDAAVRAWHRIEALRALGPVDVFSIGRRDRSPDALPGVMSWAHVDAPTAGSAPSLPIGPLAKLVSRPAGFADGANAENRLMAFVFQQRPDLIVLSNWRQRFPRALAGTRAPIVLDLLEVPEPPSASAAAGSPLRRAVETLETRRRAALRRDLFAGVAAVWVTEDVQVGRAIALGARPEAVRVVPTGIDPERFIAVRERTLPRPEGAVSGKYVLAHFGRYDDAEDEAAALLLIDEIVPQLASEFPTARLLLAGREASAGLRAAIDRTPFADLVEADDPAPYLATATAAVLLRETPNGSHEGMLTAIACGLPVVASPASAAGLAVQDRVHLLIGLPAAAADLIEELWMEPHLARSLVSRAYDIVVDRYGPEATRLAARETASVPAPS